MLIGTNNSGLLMYDDNTKELIEFNTNLTDTNVTAMYSGYYRYQGYNVFSKT